MIGQSHVIDTLTTYKKAYDKGLDIPHFGFEGNKGDGKSDVFIPYAAELFGLKPIWTAAKKGMNLDSVINGVRCDWRVGSSVWCIDEAHNASSANQQSLKTLCSAGWYGTNKGTHITFRKPVIFIATVDRSMLDAELADRFLWLSLLPYTIEEKYLAAMEHAKSRKFVLSDKDAEHIAMTQHNMRAVIRAVDGAKALKLSGVRVSGSEVLRLQHRDMDGLGLMERKVLIVLADRGGKDTLARIASAVGRTPKAIRSLMDNLENEGLIDSIPGTGRMITDEGWQKVDEIREEEGC